jgi:hypothetical protein
MTPGKIIVPLRGSDRIEQFLPYIEQVAQQGMKVVFLVHFGVSHFKELTDQLLAIHMGIQPAFLPGQRAKRQSWKTQGAPPSSEFSSPVRRCGKKV